VDRRGHTHSNISNYRADVFQPWTCSERINTCVALCCCRNNGGPDFTSIPIHDMFTTFVECKRWPRNSLCDCVRVLFCYKLFEPVGRPSGQCAGRICASLATFSHTALDTLGALADNHTAAVSCKYTCTYGKTTCKYARKHGSPRLHMNVRLYIYKV